MAHWIVADKGFGGVYYTCSNCKESWWDIYEQGMSTWEKCPNCGEELEEDHEEYVEESPLDKLKKAVSNITNVNIYKSYGYLEGKVTTLEKLTGMTLDDILAKFAAGYVLVPTRMVGAKFDEELCKRHADDSIDAFRFAYLIDEPLLNKKTIAKLIFEDNVEIDFDEKMGERSDGMLNEEKQEE